jgi:hypothetical protein
MGQYYTIPTPTEMDAAEIEKLKSELKASNKGGFENAIRNPIQQTSTKANY